LFNTLLAAFQVAVSRWIDTDDVLVGTPVANRTRKAGHETMGYFAGIVPLRGRVDPRLPFSQMLQNVHQSTVDSLAEAMPFVELTRVLGEQNAPGYNPVFDIRFALQNHPVPDVALPGLSAKLRMRSTGTPRFHLGCEITEDGDALEVVWLHRSHVLPKDEIERLNGLFQAVLAKACRSPESRCAELNS
jgi:non-ribosomal peptide synthetase component F